METLKNNITDLKTIINLANELDIDSRELAEKLTVDDDFEIGDYRFINAESIDEIQQEEMSSDTYILGCFNASFISYITDLPIKIVEALQEGQKSDVLGEYIINNNYIGDMQKEYSRLDGYGYYFAHYDHEENELFLEDGTQYYYFKIN